MELLSFIFRLGVLFAIYGFLWGIFEFGITILRAGKNRTGTEEYVFKAIKYIFLVDVTFLFCLDMEQQISYYNLALAGLILLVFFIGKLQNKQNQMALFQKIGGKALTEMRNNFQLKSEVGVIVMALAVFVLFIFYPQYSQNAISNWFHQSIININDTPVFGFIFKVIGFFFLLSLIFKMLNAFSVLISGHPFVQARSTYIPPRKNYHDKKDEDDDFEDYEEVK